MLVTLLKKQFLSTYSSFGRNKKAAGRGVRNYVLVIVFTSLLLGIVSFGILNGMCKPLLAKGFGWLYFAYVGLMSVSLSIIGSVFMAQSQLYEAKDNDFLLSLPIPSRYILFVRMVPLYVQNLIFSATILIPAYIARGISGYVSAGQAFIFIVMLFAIPLFSLFISCLLGLLIALITSKMRDKTMVTVIVSFLFMGIYFVLYYGAMGYMNTLIENSATIGEGIKKYAYLLYKFGFAFEGDFVGFAITFGIMAVLFGGLYFVLSKTYIKLVTTKRGGTKTKQVKQQKKSNSMFFALLKRDIRRFFGSGIYFLNCGLGSIMLIILTILFIIKGDFVTAKIIAGGGEAYLPFIMLVIVCFISSMNVVTGPSISLEGKTLWILQSFPVKMFDVLKSKLTLHYIVTGPIATISTIVFACILKPSPLMIISMIFLPSVMVIMSGALGLHFNLKKPNLNWDNETLVVKQSSSVLFTMLSSIGILLLIILFCVLLGRVISIDVCMIIALCLLIIPTVLSFIWLKNKGSKILENL